jgi:hypothetical protein
MAKAKSTRMFAPLKDSAKGEQGVLDRDQQAEVAAKRQASESNVRARAEAKKEVAQRNEAAHKEAVTKLAQRQQLRRDMRKGLEF